MNRVLLALILAALLLVPAGCSSLKTSVINTAEVAAAGNDRYTELAIKVLDGTVDEKNGPAITEEDLEATPKSVRAFLGRLLIALHVNRFAWHSILFQMDKGDDPEKKLEPIKLPEVKDETKRENEELLEEEQ